MSRVVRGHLVCGERMSTTEENGKIQSGVIWADGDGV
jgi:hypothetical protein